MWPASPSAARRCSAHRLVQTLDLAAEDEGSDAYRDLLREIDRAFQSFDRMAVRHGWLAGTETVDLSQAQPPPAVDLAEFVASVLEPAGDAFAVPAPWHADLQDLGGFDVVTGTIRLTRDPAQERDGQGRALMYAGRAHPLTRRAIASVRLSQPGRVAAARAGRRGWILTYVTEVGTLFRQVFALRVDRDGSVREETDFLAFTHDAAPPSHWPADQIDAARPMADAVSHRRAAAFSAAHAMHVDQAAIDARAWLDRRATVLCGKLAAVTGDLFDQGSSGDDWPPVTGLRTAVGRVCGRSRPTA